ncbi:MAG: tRNA pseudouridine(55) synthase TruB [Clostridia bacterium]|nr:tRNA pseudouridine(55) synthase TruB [Clostridia bacterium]MBR0406515.1 tRNA pseudouridine(55) synthase TruB [Clostridia bacterium]
MNGFINLLKPPGMSSGAAVAVVKRLTGEKVGHAGTLDPEAAGVLPIMVGRAARLLDYFADKSKSYIAEIAFAGATDTQDAQGVIIQSPTRVPGREEILAVLPAFRGDILQRPPAYSALKRDGVPLYELARKGVEVETKARPTVIHALELGEQTGPDGYMLSVDCGSGTYIRTLCHDIGQALDAPAHMRFLLRTRHGAFAIGNAVTIEEVIAAGEKKEIESLLLPMDFPLRPLLRLDVPENLWKLARNGGKLPAEILPEAKENAPLRVYADGALLGVAHRAGSVIRFDVGLTGGQ